MYVPCIRGSIHKREVRSPISSPTIFQNLQTFIFFSPNNSLNFVERTLNSAKLPLVITLWIPRVSRRFGHLTFRLSECGGMQPEGDQWAIGKANRKARVTLTGVCLRTLAAANWHPTTACAPFYNIFFLTLGWMPRGRRWLCGWKSEIAQVSEFCDLFWWFSKGFSHEYLSPYLSNNS